MNGKIQFAFHIPPHAEAQELKHKLQSNPSEQRKINLKQESKISNLRKTKDTLTVKHQYHAIYDPWGIMDS